jgi:ADP-ribosylglycohydrolase
LKIDDSLTPKSEHRPETSSIATDRLVGLLLGTAVGDALGLPAEGLSPRRRQRLMPSPWRHRFVFGRGMFSDDTEHALFVAQSLLEEPEDPVRFQRRLARRLRWWFASLPAGIGKATARSCLKLWVGFPPTRSGVFSAGNGPAMRSAIIGAYFHDRLEMIERFMRASTELTHTDPKALVGALAIARLAAWAVRRESQQAPMQPQSYRCFPSWRPPMPIGSGPSNDFPQPLTGD